MYILKRINNNVALVSSKGSRMIAVGKGIGFQVHPGDPVNEAFVQQRFVLQQDDNDAYLTELLREVPADMLTLAKQVIQAAEESLGTQLPTALVFTLADHISFTLERLGSGAVFEHPFSREVAQFYARELEAGERGIAVLERELHRDIPHSEAVFLAIHFANALGGLGDQHDAACLASTMGSVVRIVEDCAGSAVDRTSIAYLRFITHMRYCLTRLCKGEDAEASIDEELVQLVRLKYPKAFGCARQIIEVLMSESGSERISAAVGANELMYLTLHVNRLLTNMEN